MCGSESDEEQGGGDGVRILGTVKINNRLRLLDERQKIRRASEEDEVPVEQGIGIMRLPV